MLSTKERTRTLCVCFLTHLSFPSTPRTHSYPSMFQAYSDKSRDYTIPLSVAMQQTPVAPPTANGWQNSSYTSSGLQQSHAPAPPASSWYPSGGAYASAPPSTFPGQAYNSAPSPAYATSANPASGPPNTRNGPPGATSHPSQSPYYGS